MLTDWFKRYYAWGNSLGIIELLLLFLGEFVVFFILAAIFFGPLPATIQAIPDHIPVVAFVLVVFFVFMAPLQWTRMNYYYKGPPPEPAPVETPPPPEPQKTDLWPLVAEHGHLPPKELWPVLETLPPQAASAFIKYLPPVEEGPFTQPIYEAVNLRAMLKEFMPPLKGTPAYKTYFDNCVRMTAIQSKKNRFIWPQHFDGDNAGIFKEYLANTTLAPLFSHTIPFKIFDEHRFSHSWVLGRQGSGKTTLLSAQIWDDLQRMARGECSVIIMDSQDHPNFVHSLVRLKQFAGEWRDRLVYIEPDLQWTPALNPLDVGNLSKLSENDRYEVTQTASTVITSLFTALLNTPLTGKQTVLYEFFVPALIHIPGATLNTMLELLQEGGYQKYEAHINKAPEPVQKWFKTHMKPRVKGEPVDEFTETRRELYYRIEGIFADSLFARMLTHTENKLDLKDLMSQGKCIVINTMASRLKEKVTPFGRFFLANLLIAMQQRGSEPNPLPCFVYVDEATDYIANEEKVATLIFKSRKQNVGLTLAHHDVTDIENKRVVAALQKAAVHYTQGTQRFSWDIAINQGLRTTVTPPEINFSKMPLMTNGEWHTVLEEQRNLYTHQYNFKPQSPAPPREFGPR